MPPITRLLNSLLYFPAKRILATPRAYEDVGFTTSDGERLHGWWIPARNARASVLLFHGNAGNIGDRVLHAELLNAAGLNVFSFDYRGYGKSSGRPSEPGTYLDARAALAAMPESGKTIYLGESLGGAIALELAIHAPPHALVLMSTFTSVRAMARKHYPLIPPQLTPDAYPSDKRIARLRAPLLVIHGDEGDLVPLMYGEELYAAAPEPKKLHIVEGAGHNDLVLRAGREWAEAVASMA